ncbi:MAG: LOG family protein [Phycisphaerae bacterium]|nr:LOG family protein [Phycisphaerae bacterium]
MKSRDNTQTDDAARSAREQAINDFAEAHLPGENQDLLKEMMVTLCRLARDPADRGDVKILHKALAELRYAFKVFAPYEHVRKISIFGSSRTPEDHPDYHTAVDFARRMREAGWMAITGAGDGIMKAGHDGAGVEASFGVAIRLPFEQETNRIIADDVKLVNFRYFFTRKLMFMKAASAIALFPGGFGTQDEGFEALTLIQTGKSALTPIVLVEQPGGSYWLQWRAYVKSELLSAGMIGPEDMHLFRITDNVEVAVREVVQFYRVYHSMRYVGDDLVLRLQRPISGTTLERLNDEFASLLSAGCIEQCAALPQESGEYPDMPRLKLRFDRRSVGVLRRLVNVVNGEAAGDAEQA